MMRRCALALAAIAVAAGPAEAAHWSVDYAKSRLGFSVLWSNEPFAAAFRSWKADIDFDPAAPGQAHASVSVDLASETSDESDFDDGVKGALGFQTSQFPQAKFVTKSFVHRQGDGYVAIGDLTLKGITRSITLPFTLAFAGNAVHMKGAAVVVRTEFGVGQGMWAAPSPVAHDVTVTIDITATRP